MNDGNDHYKHMMTTTHNDTENWLWLSNKYNTYLKYNDNKEEFIEDNISLSIKSKVQLFLFLHFIRYLILIQLTLSFLILNIYLQ